MFRLFIIDDNQYERNGIKNSINWSELGVEVAGVFATAFEAMEKINELEPDIIITDISMPGMNGIEMSKRILKEHPGIKIIFISCHSDFEYAKSAISLGVHGYVLKPVLADELLHEVNNVIEELNLQELQKKENEKALKQIDEMLPLVQEQFLKELLLGNFRENDDIMARMEFLRIRINHGSIVRIISIKLMESQESTEDKSVINSYLVSYSIKNIVASCGTEVMSISPVQISGTEYAAVLFEKEDVPNNPDAITSGREYTLNIAVNINQEITRKLGINTIMGISGASKELKEIALLYKQSSSAVNTMLYSGSNPIIFFEEVEDNGEKHIDEMPGMVQLHQEIRSLISFGSDREINEFIEKYLSKEGFKYNENYVKGFASSVVNIIGILLMEINLSFKDIFKDEIFLWKKLGQLHTIIDVKHWIYNVFKTIKEHIAEKHTIKNGKVVNSIKEFIKSKYNEQISINDISKAIHFSGRYANSLFKKETGKTIFDYVIEYRMEKAKKLLREKDMNVALVAESVGYTNTSYFCLSFKKIVGITPAEYKRKGIM